MKTRNANSYLVFIYFVARMSVYRFVCYSMHDLRLYFCTLTQIIFTQSLTLTFVINEHTYTTVTLSMCEILFPSVLWCLNLLGTLDIKLISCTFVITVGMEYNICFFGTQFGKQFVHFVFLGAHVSAVSLPLSPAGTFICITYVWIIIGFTLCLVFCICAAK